MLSAHRWTGVREIISKLGTARKKYQRETNTEKIRQSERKDRQRKRYQQWREVEEKSVIRDLLSYLIDLYMEKRLLNGQFKDPGL
jgi:hypothetical protein